MNGVVQYQADFQVDGCSTDEILEELCKYGEPSLSKHNKGWHSRINVFVTGQGVEFKVQTSFKEPNAHAAVRKLHQLTIDSIRQLASVSDV